MPGLPDLLNNKYVSSTLVSVFDVQGFYVMQTIEAELFYATITVGLTKSYSGEPIPVEKVYDELAFFQSHLIASKKIYLSANCTLSTIVLSGQLEPHVNIKFINYPRFPLSLDIFKSAVLETAHHLQQKLHQNRLVIEFHDSIVMLQQNEDTDPAILTSH